MITFCFRCRFFLWEEYNCKKERKSIVFFIFPLVPLQNMIDYAYKNAGLDENLRYLSNVCLPLSHPRRLAFMTPPSTWTGPQPPTTTPRAPEPLPMTKKELKQRKRPSSINMQSVTILCNIQSYLLSMSVAQNHLAINQ